MMVRCVRRKKEYTKIKFKSGSAKKKMAKKKSK